MGKKLRAFAGKDHPSVSWDFLALGRNTNRQNAGIFWAGKFAAGIPGIVMCSCGVPESVCVWQEEVLV